LSNLETEWRNLKTRLILEWNEFALSLGLPSWGNIITAWEEGGGEEGTFEGYIGGLKAIWDDFVGHIFGTGGKEGRGGSFWDTNIGQFFVDVSNAIQGVQDDLEVLGAEETARNFGRALGTMMADGILAALTMSIEGDGKKGISIFSVGSAFADGFWRGFSSRLVEIAVDAFIATWIGNIVFQIGLCVVSFVETADNLIDAFWGAVEMAVKWGIKWILTPLLAAFLGAIHMIFQIGSPSRVFMEIGRDLILGLFEGIQTTITDAWSTVETALNTFVEYINTFFFGAMGGGGYRKGGLFNGIGVNIVQGLIDGIVSMTSKLASSLVDTVRNAILYLLGLLEQGSPSKLFYDIGENMMLGMALGIQKSSGLVRSSLMGIGNMAATVTMGSTMQSPPVMGNRSLTMGDVTINNSMDWQVFKAQVQRAIFEG
jgi:hypothetical protein